MKKAIALLGLLVLTGCMPPKILCFLNFPDYSKTYEFNCSKEELKNRIVSAYWYDSGLFSRAFLGKTDIENQDLNKKYKAQHIWLDRHNWKQFEPEIRANTGDTLNLLVGKYASPRDEIRFQVVIKGDQHKSSLTINGLDFQQVNKCKAKTDYRKKLSRKIKRKFIRKLD